MQRNSCSKKRSRASTLRSVPVTLVVLVAGLSRLPSQESDSPDRPEATTEATPPHEPLANDELVWSPVWNREQPAVPNSLRGVYDKPFLAQIWRTVSVGGYTEFEYHSFEDGTLGIPQGFRMHRTNLFLFADVGDRVRFGAELEFETEFEGQEPSSETETAVEMAFVDWIIFEELKLRAGALLAPLGRTNVNHDGPVRELTERPLVATFVIPTTLTEAGAGAWGDVDLADAFALRYEAYAVNGFNVLSEDGDLVVDLTEREKILREGSSSNGGDGNDDIAFTGRLALQTFDRLEVGGSWHVGTYDERADNWLYIFAGDLTWVQPIGAAEFSVEGEIASARFERDTFARTAGVPDVFWGYSIQGAITGMPSIVRESIPNVFDDEEARLGAVFRYEWVDLDGDRGEVLEPGLTFRPLADTVFKFSYRFTQRSVGLRNVPGRDDFDDDGVAISVTTYF